MGLFKRLFGSYKRKSHRKSLVGSGENHVTTIYRGAGQPRKKLKMRAVAGLNARYGVHDWLIDHIVHNSDGDTYVFARKAKRK